MVIFFSRRFREGISFPNFVERCIPELPISKLWSVPFSLQNRALFEGKKGRKGAEKRGGRGVASKGGKKEKRTRENRSELMVICKGWFETAPCRVTLATPFPAHCPRILGTRFTNYGLRMFCGEVMVIWKRWFETVPCRATLNTPFSALCPRILGTRFTNYGLRMFWGELMVIWKGWFETVPCRAALNTQFSALCPRILGTRSTNYGLRVSG